MLRYSGLANPKGLCRSVENVWQGSSSEVSIPTSGGSSTTSRGLGGINSGWAVFLASILEADDQSCDLNVVCACRSNSGAISGTKILFSWALPRQLVGTVGRGRKGCLST